MFKVGDIIRYNVTDHLPYWLVLRTTTKEYFIQPLTTEWDEEVEVASFWLETHYVLVTNMFRGTDA